LTQVSSVYGTQPIFGAIDLTAAPSDSYSPVLLHHPHRALTDFR